MKKVKICILLMMGLFIFCSCESEENCKDNSANMQMTEHVQESDEKENDITADNQDEVITTDKVSEQDEIVNEDNVDEISLYVVEPIMTMDQVYAGEREKIIKCISNFSDIDYDNARELDSFQNEIIEGDVLFLIADNTEKDIKVYGYKSEEYACRGIIIRYGSVNSYFDYSWDDVRGPKGLYVADFDKDGKDEIVLCLAGGYGTGYSVERLIIFEESDENRQLVSYELTRKNSKVK